MDGVRGTVRGDGVDIGLLTAGSGPPLLLVHGGVGQIERWEPVWDLFARRYTVTAMDRRGRGSSGDAADYSVDAEFGDVAAVCSELAAEAGRPASVFAHSYGATCAIGAAGRDGPIGRLILYEPPSAATVTPAFVDRMAAYVSEGRAGRAMVAFLQEIIGLDDAEVDALRQAPPAYDILAVLAATLPREGRALLGIDLVGVARSVTCPTRFLLGDRSPVWAAEVTDALARVIPGSTIEVLPAVGHEAIDAAPAELVDRVARVVG